MRIAVSGASGFVGSEVCRALAAKRLDVAALGRDGTQRADVNDFQYWKVALAGADALIHLAARAHVIRDVASDPLAEFRKVNVDGTLNIARAAVAVGMKRIVFVSSIGVLGSASGNGVFSEASPALPTEAYAVSKYEAECALSDPAISKSIEVVIVRPPLVYGPRVRGNFLRLLSLAANNLPLPLGSVAGTKSFIGVTNLADVLTQCAIDQHAGGETFLVSDGQDITLPTLLSRLRELMGRQPRIFPCPVSLLRGASALLGRSADLAKLTSTLRVNSEKVRSALSWKPPLTLDQGLERMVRWYMDEAKDRA